MKNIVYRIQFRIEETGNKSLDRNEKLDSILSSMENIDTNQRITPPNIGSVIEIDGNDYVITGIKYSFYQENDYVQKYNKYKKMLGDDDGFK